ncbi:hypothetical protein N7524_007359 [Penicillium chrysogenum]|nr:hypothetical protein N7524_007359 [Penicillium chrysogenum]
MKSFSLALVAYILQHSFGNAQYTVNVPVKEIKGEWTINGNRITWTENGFKTSIDCDNEQGHNLRFAGCCLPDQSLVGDPDSAFDCCAGGHDLAGSKETGYRCCPTGWTYDGEICEEQNDVTCSNGKALVDGKCVCPTGSSESSDGVCEPQKCVSGLETGKCYNFIGENGFPLGYNGANYVTAEKSGYQMPGKLQFCKDEECTPGQQVDPGQLVYIKDVHGGPASQGGLNPNQWLNNFKNGGHIRKTAKIGEAGEFTVTRWPCGKYCVGGFEYGLGPACPAPVPAITFLTLDKQACVPFDFVEVPCDVTSTSNNCIWKNGADQCCDKVDCSGL